MKLLLCRQCNDGVFDTQALIKEGRKHCPKCKKPLVYLGREAVKLSSKQEFTAYDKIHTQSPLETYRGIHKKFYHNPASADILECEEMLRLNPTNRDALAYLSKRYKTMKDYKRAKDYLEQLHQVQSHDPKPLEELAHIAILEENYGEAVKILKREKQLSDTPQLSFRMAVATYFNNDIDACNVHLNDIIKNSDDAVLIEKAAHFVNSLQDE